ncbi:hypothetical protein KY290_026050 [Solanum tuberosum]|uniref:MHD1 domain-containing protein n=1 Tax=Solanum tuberosum TaxID=4113 RepID=A0ABQ7UVC7_SOLTU|nr:hypothetical protein KY284_025297 [Solanum tuberosum]KAH0755780.1 hypothetical protein KY290_026050 [Solanum tuberosum]
MGQFQIETVSGTLVLRWVNSQLARILNWVDRDIQQERWVPVSPQQRHGSSIVEVYRIVEEFIQFPRHKFIVFRNGITVIWKKSCDNLSATREVISLLICFMYSGRTGL